MRGSNEEYSRVITCVCNPLFLSLTLTSHTYGLGKYEKVRYTPENEQRLHVLENVLKYFKVYTLNVEVLKF